LCLRATNNANGQALRDFIFGIMRENQSDPAPRCDADLNKLKKLLSARCDQAWVLEF